MDKSSGKVERPNKPGVLPRQLAIKNLSRLNTCLSHNPYYFLSSWKKSAASCRWKSGLSGWRAVRDALLGLPIHDLDFALSGDVLPLARNVANSLGANYYPLDEERQTGRVLLSDSSGHRQILDFAALRGPDLESDLRGRDFTINAIAVTLDEPQVLLDPLGGAADLIAKRLRACSPTSLDDDPLRILRGVRLAAAYQLNIEMTTRQWMRHAASGLAHISPERVRDELFRLLDGRRPDLAIRALDLLGALPYVLPELTALKGVLQSPPHIHDVWNHTLDLLQRLDQVLGVLLIDMPRESTS